jgi:hypothetical protein
MFKGYRNRLMSMDKTNKSVSSLAHVNKCTKCQRLNPSLHSSVLNNIQQCLFCGNPFYIVRMDK